MAVLRGLLKRGTLLENNMVQTIGSVGESLAAGMIFTIPALFVFAYTDNNPAMAPTFWRSRSGAPSAASWAYCSWSRSAGC